MSCQIRLITKKKNNDYSILTEEEEKGLHAFVRAFGEETATQHFTAIGYSEEVINKILEGSKGA